MAQQIVWGTITLHLDNEEFRSGPLLPENDEERQKRNACIVVLPEA